ncbi:MAG: alpha/beta fold hydrolase [Candidatus Gracilibacteria bacterium]
MSNIFIFHGTGGHPQENWFPWLKAELVAKGHNVYIPKFPTPEGQSLEAWLDVLKPYEDKINEDSILIGHSLGGLFLLRVLERLQTKVKTTVFVGAPIGVKPIKFYESDEKFSGFDFDWDAIRTKATHFIVFHSDNDPYVSLANGELLAKELGTNLTFIPNAGHFNSASGYIKFEELLKFF